ncbi:MAG TPA: hypothetical protein VJG49_02645 [Candidatus Nanoarchaeia archaeon]|nr:hypothetical protein [Candidatus Nanoarchaeia archaeon]
MFEKYRSLDELMAGEGRRLLQDELNDLPLYLKVVSILDLKRIGITVYDERWKEIGVYSSINDNDGMITDIVDGCLGAAITVGIQEQTILDVLRDLRSVKQELEDHLVSTVCHYWGLVRISPLEILKYIPRLIIHFPELYSAFRHS